MNSNKKQLLVADDDRLILATVSNNLRQAGYTVYEAENGAQAIDICKQHQPDLAILDIRMPGIDGIETGRQVQQKTGTPFIIFSAYGSDQDTINRAISCGALGYLVKPIDPEQMIPAIETAIQRAKDLSVLYSNKSKLVESLNSNRTTSTAVGIIMERHKLSKESAFESLRSSARQSREKIEKVATEIVNSSNLLNQYSS